jgi:RNA polymerase sigma factor (sigma-70 family)
VIFSKNLKKYFPAPLANSEVEEYDRIYLEDRIKKKVSTLPPKLRVVFQLSSYHHMNEKEIACKLDLTTSAVKSRLHRARQSMKRKMSEVEDQDYSA